MSKVSVIIPHYNGEEILKDCLESLFQSTRVALEVILVDNGSSDDSVDMVRHLFPDVVVLQQEKNLGFAGGCNVGIKAAANEYVLILNNDTTHEKNWIEYLLETLESDQKIAAVQPKLISYQNPGNFDYSGANGGEMDIFGFPFARGRFFHHIEKDEKQYDHLDREIIWASGTAFLARRSLLLEAGLFDATFFAHMEEIDLDWRLRLMGYTLAVDPRARIFHRSGYTLGAESPFKKYLNHRNSLYMLIANYRWTTLLYILPARILLDWMAAIESLVTFDFGRFRAVFKAHFWLLFHLPMIKEKRKKTSGLRKVSDRAIMHKFYKKPIALVSFILKKNKYADLYDA
ncbi:MAG: glycosyltransferase [Candidatus Marinimicrobia bacterium]|nr:glycosyltransferase [Candidatus Neomarinimicrobiota bacterium]